MAGGSNADLLTRSAAYWDAMDAAETDEEREAVRRAWVTDARNGGRATVERPGVEPGDWVGVEPVRLPAELKRAKTGS